MLNVENIRQDFPMLQGKMMQQHPLIYLDNGATTLKPRAVIDAVVKYYEEYGANAHRGDYDLSYFVDQEYQQTREDVAAFLHAESEEIVYTSGATAGLNMVAYGIGERLLQEGDIVLSSEAEHASCVLPWMRVATKCHASLAYIPLQEDGRIDMDMLEQMMNERVKVIALAHIGNVLGYIAPMKEICALAHRYGAIVVVDAAQSAPHMPIDVKDMDCDFLAFSAHKMCGPTGVGIMYGKYDLLCETKPTRLGGGSNSRYNSCGVVTLKNPPYKFEAGTPNIEGVIGLGAAVEYLSKIGMDNICAHEKELRQYCIKKMQELDNVEIYNVHSDGAVAFNIKGVFSQDAASLFNTYGIAVRAGQHCAKILDEFLNVSTTLRVSFYFYNTKEEIDQFIEVCKKGDDFLDAFFG